MTDTYAHGDSRLIYTETNLPGPSEDNDEYKELMKTFNSRLTDYCTCVGLCTYPTCKCLEKSDGPNYHMYMDHGEPKLLLNSNKNINLVIECNNECYCLTTNCGNRLVQIGPVNGLVVKTCEIDLKGLGLFTSFYIRKGTFICEYAGELLTKSQAVTRNKINQLKGGMNYVFCLNEHCNGTVVQTFVDPGHFGNIGRYINHSCEPNCHIVPVRHDSPIPKLAIFARCDIEPDKEITFNYGSYKDDNVEPTESNVNRKKCLCRSKNCAGYMPYDTY
ncbi:probable histone-lysine N-methyltransferase set-23 [Manduca sexta]|uniref:Histone-lysine N-methyltransferase set-23 n=1 Tax=Manduca sexta TaxID=7130 RepID=A0A922CPC0_MANSE|nr:probable histone-lysine N-methyltransferase set-23 [Manduca sexta]KAG6453304.1 hypothetical protein O3G_MSEX008079 [Manduca sexta]